MKLGEDMKLSKAAQPTMRDATGRLYGFESVFTTEEAEKVDAIQNIIAGMSLKEAKSLFQRLIQAINDCVIITECSVFSDE